MNKMTVDYLQRKNDGNFEHRELKVSTVIEGKNESELLAMTHAVAKLVEKVLNGEVVTGKSESEVVKETIKAAKKEIELKNGKGSEVPAEDVAPVEDKKVESPKEDAPTQPESKKRGKKPLDEAMDKVGETAKKGKAPKVEPYDRSNDKHKTQLSAYFDDKHEGWDGEETFDKFKAATIELVGKPFRGSDGEILPEFIAELEELVK